MEPDSATVVKNESSNSSCDGTVVQTTSPSNLEEKFQDDALERSASLDMCDGVLDESSGAADENGAFDQSPQMLLKCAICTERYVEPRVLPCLHVYCTHCLVKLVESSNRGTASNDLTSIVCPNCKQMVRLQGGGIMDLPLDVIMTNMMDMEDIGGCTTVCTSCKAQEKAVARCCDCSSFLCPNCVTAHNYMRCFENHKVESFEELKKEGINIHKPMFCQLHPTEQLKYFCNNCQVLVCSECMLFMHKPPDHVCERVTDPAALTPGADKKYTEDLQALLSEAKNKVSVCNDTSEDRDAMLTELQQQKESARDLINETFHSYKAALEKRKDELLEELDSLHSSNELSVMDKFHDIEKAVEMIEHGCQFTERVLEHGNALEILSLKKHIARQLMKLLNNIPTTQMNVKMEFMTDGERFSKMLRATFGYLQKDDDSGMKSVHGSLMNTSLQSSFDNDMNIQSQVSPLSPGSALMTPLSSNTTITDFMPTSNGLAGHLPAALSGMPADLAASIVTSLSGLGLHGGAMGMGGGGPGGLGHGSAIERSMSRNSYSPAMSDSGISVDAASSCSTTGGTVVGSGHSPVGHSLAMLSKFGNIGVNAQGQITVNGQPVPGLTLNSLTAGLTGSSPPTVPPISTNQGLPGRPATMQASHLSLPDNVLTGLLNSVSTQQQSCLPPGPPTAQQLADLRLLFNSPAAGALMPSLPGGSVDASLSGLVGSVGCTTSPITVANLVAHPPPNLSVNGGSGMPGAISVGPLGSPDALDAGSRYRSSRNSNKISAMQIRCKFGQLGPGKGQFNSPHGFCLGMDEDIVVADTNNHRIQVFEKTGDFKYQFGIPGREEGQLWYPRKVAVIRTSGKYVVCDRGSERSRMQLFTKSGQFIKKIAIRYIDIVAGLAITAQGNIVAVDSVSPTVFCIAESGDLIKWFDCSDYMREPSDIAVSGKDYYVCDFKGHCVVVFNENGEFIHRIGCENVTNYPNGIDISDAGDVLIGDSHGNRFHVAVFQRDGSLIGEFECPYVKVSRCCGLKITSEGYVVTLAKNNQHVLVLNTLYIA